MNVRSKSSLIVLVSLFQYYLMVLLISLFSIFDSDIYTYIIHV